MFSTITFFSVWYWVSLAGFWSAATHFTHGVPYGLMWRAARHGGADAAICDALARANLARIAEGVARWGVWGAAAAGFALAALATAAVWAQVEVAAGLLAMAAPAAVMTWASLSEAVRLAAAPPEGERELLHALFRRRWTNQVFGAAGVLIAAATFVVLHRDRIAFMQGPGGW